MLANGWWGRLFDLPVPRQDEDSPRIGLVLSCGGARGLAHIGAIQVLEEERIPITALAGSSMGAYVGALWAAGISGHDLGRLAAEIKDRRALVKLLDPVCPPTTGFVRGNKVRRYLERTLGAITIEDLKTPTLIVGTNLDTVTGEVFPPGTPVAAAIQASCAIPGICSPVNVNGKRYIDGGASQPLPVGLLRRHAALDAVIAINVMATEEDISHCRDTYPTPPRDPAGFSARLRQGLNRSFNLFAYGNVLDTFKRCLTAAQLRLLTEESKLADVVIHPYLCESRWYDYENFERYIEAGRLAARQTLPQLRMLMHPTHKSQNKNTSDPTPDHETVPLITSVGCGSA